MSEIHSILFNMHILYSIALGVWAAAMAARGEGISGNFWGAVAVYTGLVGITLLAGIALAAMGLRPRDGRLALYFIYMAFLLVIMPGLFSMLRGRDDRSAAIAFALLAFFNASVSLSMASRELVGPWVDA
ncbi:MAG: hypothetical protein OHK0046_00850 [Anaerolineae bacterium]